METNQVLGIVLARNHAVLVLGAGHEDSVQIRDVLTVGPPGQGDKAVPLSTAIGQTLRSRGLIWDEAAVSLDSEYYSQYPMHSMFTDARQIESTIKYDAEEVTAADAATLAITFETLRSGPEGSDVVVYSADRQGLTDLLLDLQVDGIDPTLMEPDGVCLGRALDQLAEPSQHPETLYVVVGHRNCTILRASGKADAKRFRSFLLNTTGPITDILISQLRLTLAAWSQDEAIEKIEVYGSTDQIDLRKLSESLSLPAELLKPRIELPSVTGAAPSTDRSEILTAWGAALTLFSRGRKADFRQDFMPYQGRKKILQNCLRIFSISAAVILLTFGVYFQLKTFRMNSYSSELNQKLVAEYKTCMGVKSPPASEPIVSRLKREVTRAKKIQQGLGPGDEKSITAKMTYVLDSFNDTPQDIQFVLEQFVINDSMMRIKGNTKSRRNTRALRDSIKKHPKLRIDTEDIVPAPGMDKFTITLKMEEGK